MESQPDYAPPTIETTPSSYSGPNPDSLPPSYAQQTNQSAEDVFDMEFLTGVGGILKALQMIFSLITFICSTVPAWVFAALGGGWVQFVSMTAFLCTAILYIFHLFKLPPKFPSRVPFKFLEVCYYFFFFLCYFTCGIICSVNGWIDPSIGAAAFFSFASMVLYGIDIYFRNMAWRHSGEGPYFSSMSLGGGGGGSSSSAADTQY